MKKAIDEIVISRKQAQDLLRDIYPTDKTLLAIRDAIIGRTMTLGEFAVRVTEGYHMASCVICPPERHRQDITGPTKQGHYWWICACGDEGGPYESYNRACDAIARHKLTGSADDAKEDNG